MDSHTALPSPGPCKKSRSLNSAWSICEGDSFANLKMFTGGAGACQESLGMEGLATAVFALSLYLVSAGGHMQSLHSATALLNLEGVHHPCILTLPH